MDTSFQSFFDEFDFARSEAGDGQKIQTNSLGLNLTTRDVLEDSVVSGFVTLFIKNDIQQGVIVLIFETIEKLKIPKIGKNVAIDKEMMDCVARMHESVSKKPRASKRGQGRFSKFFGRFKLGKRATRNSIAPRMRSRFMKFDWRPREVKNGRKSQISKYNQVVPQQSSNRRREGPLKGAKGEDPKPIIKNGFQRQEDRNAKFGGLGEGAVTDRGIGGPTGGTTSREKDFLRPYGDLESKPTYSKSGSSNVLFTLPEPTQRESPAISNHKFSGLVSNPSQRSNNLSPPKISQIAENYTPRALHTITESPCSNRERIPPPKPKKRPKRSNYESITIERKVKSKKVTLFTFAREHKNKDPLTLVLPFQIDLNSQIPCSHEYNFTLQEKPRARLGHNINQIKEKMHINDTERPLQKSPDPSTATTRRIKDYIKVETTVRAVYVPYTEYKDYLKKVRSKSISSQELSDFLPNEEERLVESDNCLEDEATIRVYKNFHKMEGIKPKGNLLRRSMKVGSTGIQRCCQLITQNLKVDLELCIQRPRINYEDGHFNIVFRFGRQLLCRYRRLDILLKSRLSCRYRVQDEFRFIERIVLAKSYDLDDRLPRGGGLENRIFELVKKIDIGKIRKKLVSIQTIFSNVEFDLCFYVSREAYQFEEMVFSKKLTFFKIKGKGEENRNFGDTKKLKYTWLSERIKGVRNALMLPFTKLKLEKKSQIDQNNKRRLSQQAEVGNILVKDSPQKKDMKTSMKLGQFISNGQKLEKKASPQKRLVARKQDKKVSNYLIIPTNKPVLGSGSY